MSAESTAADRINDALAQFVACIGESLDGICSYGLSPGDEYVPFNPDPDEDDDQPCGDDEAATCDQVWVRVAGAGQRPGGSTGWDGSRCGTLMRLDLEVGVVRCYGVPENGEASTATDAMAAVFQSMEDMDRMLCAALSCGATEEDPKAGVWDAIIVGQWTPITPTGGQYGGMWSFTVDL